MPPGTPQLSPQRSRSLVTAFPSPTTAAPSQKPPFQGQRSRPATSRPAGSFPARSALCSPASAGLPQSRTDSSLRPVAVRLARLARLLPLPPLPSRTFTSLGIEAFNRFRRFAAHLPTTPDFLSLPAAGSISRVGCGSPFLDRYVSGGLLFLKPLGTFFTMPSSPFFVNGFYVLRRPFSSAFIWLVSKWLRRNSG
jgi:hypothetical protein